MPIEWIDRSRAHFDQDFFIAWGWLFYFFTAEDFGRTVVTTDDGLHREARFQDICRIAP